MPLTITYNNSIIATLTDAGTKTLLTRGTFLNYDVGLQDVTETCEDRYFAGTLVSYYDSVVTSIGSFAFGRFSRILSEVNFPNVTNIGPSAFYNCASLKTVSFPKAVTIQSTAFYLCTYLAAVAFPSVTSIELNAFGNCSSLATISFPNATNIGSSAFTLCSSLSVASFPKATVIGSRAFYSCVSLSAVYLTGSSLVSLQNSTAFLQTPISSSSYLGYFGSIYVPNSLLANYKTATNWSLYSDRFVGV